MTLQMTTQYHVRWMIRKDMPEVLDIENLSFCSPWTEEDFIRCLKQRTCIGQIVEGRDHDVLAFMVHQLHKKYYEILNIAVHPNHRRRGLASLLVASLEKKLLWTRRPSMQAVVRESNLPAHLFFKSSGWSCHQILKGHYVPDPTVDSPFDLDSPEDGYVFVRYLETTNDC